MPHTDSPSRSTPQDTRGDRLSGFTHSVVIGMGALFLIALVILLILSGRPESTQLRFNPYALFSAVSLISNLVAFVFIMRIKQRTDVLLWFSVFLLTLAAWAAAEMMVRLSATAEGAVFWGPYTTMGAVFMPIMLYMFALAYTDAKRTLNPLLFPILLGVSTLLVFMDTTSQILTIYSPDAALAAWGFVSKAGPAFFFIPLWLMGLSTAALILLLRFRNRNIEPTLRRQTKLFAIAIIIPLIGGGITDGILPALHIVALPPMSVMLLTIMGVTICYGILRTRFFSFTPGLIAAEILHTMNEAVIGVTPDFKLRYVNDGAERLLGLSAKDLADRDFHSLLAEDWGPIEMNQKIFDHLKEDDFYTLDSIKFRSPDEQIITKLSITKVAGEGQPNGYLVVLTDITALAQTTALIEQKVVERTKQLHEEQAKLQASIESLTLGFVFVDENGAVIIQNQALAAILDLPEKVVSAEQLEKYAPNINLRKQIGDVFKTGQPAVIKEINLGSKVLQIFMGPVAVNENGQTHIIGTVILVEDVTEAKVMERSKDEFFSIASHELRTPLTSIKGNSSMVLEYYKEALKEEGLKEMIEDMHSSSVRLIELVNDFLDTTRLEQGKVSFAYSAIPVESTIESVVHDMKNELSDKKLYLTIDKPTPANLPLVWADANRLKQVIYNLVGNAIKFTDKGGITIQIKTTGKFLEILIIDTGRGMTLDSQQMLFHKFQQASSSLLTRDTTKGTGLGLYISRMIAESMGGNVTLVSSTPEAGSTFSITLPIATDQQRTSAPAPTAATDSTTGLTITEPKKDKVESLPIRTV